MNWDREKKTIEVMIRLYCRGNHHKGKSLCGRCEELREYAMVRLEKCPHGESKPVCSKCPTHCYKRDKREEIRQIMRWSGPRMLLRHPILAIDHLIQIRKPFP